MNSRNSILSGMLGIALSLGIATADAKVILLNNVAEEGGGGFAVNNLSENDQEPFLVAGINDVNGDDAGDFLIAMPSQNSPDGTADTGVVYVVFGKGDGEQINLDAVAAGQGGYAIYGLDAEDQLGYAVSRAGDVNGDEIQDFIIHALNGSPDSERPNVGVSYVIYGQNAQTSTQTREVDLANFQQQSSSGASAAGFAINGFDDGAPNTTVSNAGDINNDGFADILIGKPQTTVVNAQGDELPAAGAVYVVLGKADANPVELSAINQGQADSGGFMINGFEAGSEVGTAIATIGRVNGDELDDFVIGAPGADLLGENAGQAFVIFGNDNFQASSARPIDLSRISAGGTPGFNINGANSNDLFGFAVSAAGDVNGDNRADILVGAPGVNVGDNSEAGAAYVVFGKSSNSPVDISEFGRSENALGFAMLGTSTGDDTGFAVTSPFAAGVAGDFNSDGLPEVIVAAPSASPLSIEPPPDMPPQDTGQDTGGSNVSPPDSDTQGTGPDSGTSDLPPPDITPPPDPIPQQTTQSSLRQDDPLNSPAAGLVFMVPGQRETELIALSDLQNGVVGNVLVGIAAEDMTGDSVDFTTDMNGDGLPELLIAAPQAEVNPDIPNAGRVFVLFSDFLRSDDMGDLEFVIGPVDDIISKSGNLIDFTLVIPEPIPGVKLRIEGLPKDEAHISPQEGRFSWKPRNTGVFNVKIIAEQTETDPIERLDQVTFTITVEPATTNLTSEDVAQLDDSRMTTVAPDDLAGLDDEKVRDIPPEGFSVMDAEQVSALTYQGMGGVQPVQYRELPKESLQGINANNMGGLPPDVIREMSSEDLQALDAEEMKKAPPPDLAKLLTNLEPDQIDIDSVKALLPDDWTLDENTGDIFVPDGTKLKFRAFDLPSVERLALPEVPDMSKGLGVGGQASRNLLDAVNTSLVELEGSTETSRFEMQQKEDGILQVQGTGDFSDLRLSLIPDGESFEQVEEVGEVIESSRVTLEPDTGRYLVITADNQEMAFRPAPHRPSDILASLGENASVRVGDAGELIVSITETDETERRDITTYSSYTVDPFLETSSEDSGIYANEDGSYTVVYSDGTSQSAVITVPSPSTFISEAYTIIGVESVIYTSNGTFSVTYEGIGLTLTALSQSTQSLSGAEPYIVINTDGTLSYGVQEDISAIVTVMSIQ